MLFFVVLSTGDAVGAERQQAVRCFGCAHCRSAEDKQHSNAALSGKLRCCCSWYCAHVTRLGQGNNDLSDVSGVRIAEALETNSTVTQLSLVSCDVVVRGIVHT